MVSHRFEDSTEGVPQGGPLSPILSNILLNELDKELTKRGHPFVRYADMKDFIEKTSEWCNRRIRMYIWKNWKRVRTRLYGGVRGRKTKVGGKPTSFSSYSIDI